MKRQAKCPWPLLSLHPASRRRWMRSQSISQPNSPTISRYDTLSSSTPFRNPPRARFYGVCFELGLLHRRSMADTFRD